MKRRAFTLIELLVVVAIIALLIAILLPSLGRAKERAKLTTCGTHLRALTQGSITYASEWSGWLPPMQNWDSGYVTPYTYEVKVSSVVGLGLLFQNGAITDPRVYYCPSQTNYGFSYDPQVAQQYGGWLKIPRGSDGGGRTGYSFQVHANYVSGSFQVAYNHIADFPATAILGSDFIQGADYIAHGSKSRPADTNFNLVFIDGHVQTVSGNATRPLGKDVYGAIHAASTAVGDMNSYGAHIASGAVVFGNSKFGDVAGTYGSVVFDLEYAAQQK